MSFPMSWTSPLTVAMTIFGLEPPSDRPLSIYGSRISTAVLMTLADFTTCGRNILPSPNIFPTVSIPSISGPSIIATALPYVSIASFKSASSESVRPFMSAAFSLMPASVFPSDALSWAPTEPFCPSPAVVLSAVALLSDPVAAFFASIMRDALSMSLSVA